MTAAELQPYNEGVNPFMFFEDDRPKKAFCKVYSDGGHCIATPTNQVKHPDRQKHEVTELQEMFDSLYAYTIAENYGKAQTDNFLRDNLCHMFEDGQALDDYITEQKKRKAHNLHARKKRFRRKAFLNRWNFFITITYSDEKMTEQEFREKLRRCLCNLHTRRGWRYMGVFERAPETKRLHFHALLYVPDGEMLGKIAEKKDYSTKRHKMQTTHENTFFAERYGRNDFAAIKAKQLEQAASYCLKYIEKTGERLTYSRGVPAEIERQIHKDDIICKMRDFVTKYILFDDAIDYETDVLKLRPPESLFDLIPRYLN